MAPEARREELIFVTRPLLLEHGRATTTKLIAEAAGIAEGTIFRIFSTKEELFDAVLDAEFKPDPFLAELERIPRDVELRERMLELTRMMQRRFQSIFRMMIAMGMPKPPSRRREDNEHFRKHVEQRMAALLELDARAFRIPLTEVVRMLRLLTFSGTHPHISDDQALTAEEIVDVILHGTLREPQSPPPEQTSTEEKGR
jgi:AcrR family transcriptional regulator